MDDAQWLEVEHFLSFASSFSLTERIAALHLHILMPIRLVGLSFSDGTDGLELQAYQTVLRHFPPHHQERVCKGGSNKYEPM